MLSRMRVLSSAPVIETVTKVIHLIAETYFEPNLTLRDLRGKGDEVDILRHFSEACRADHRRRGVRAEPAFNESSQEWRTTPWPPPRDLPSRLDRRGLGKYSARTRKVFRS